MSTSSTGSDSTDFSSLFSQLLSSSNNNPGLTSALVSGLGTLMSPAQAASQTNQSSVNLPNYIAPYVGSMLNSAQSLVSNPYQPYQGQQVAGFNNTQNQAFNNIQNMTNSTPQQQQGAGIVGQAANQLMGNAGSQWNNQTAAQYMSPYQQQVNQIAINQNDQNAQIQNTANNAAAAQAGAFGGDRQAIVQAQLQKNTQLQDNNIETTGLNNAYMNAELQFNTGLQNSNTAAGTAANAGNTLAGIGQQQFQNTLANNQNLLGVGNQQQANTQQNLTTGYQNYQNQLNYPYQQLQFMQSMMNGLPMTQTSTATTGSTPSLTNQLIGNGIGAYNTATNGATTGTTSTSTGGTSSPTYDSSGNVTTNGVSSNPWGFDTSLPTSP